MTRISLWGSLRCTALVLLLASLAGPSPAQAPGKTPALLCTGHYYHTGINHEVAAALQTAGFAVNADGHPGLSGRPLTLERLNRYNVVVVRGLDNANPDGTLTAQNVSDIAVLTQYLEAGGGVLFFPVFCEQEGMIPPNVAFLARFGLKPLFDEVVVEPGSRTLGTAYQIPFARTESFPAKDSPVVQGIKRLWYPEAVRAGAQTHTVPLLPDQSWTILVSGGAGASTLALRHGAGATPEALSAAAAGSFARDPVLMASRPVGKGRLICLGITPEYLINQAATRALDRIVYERGLRGTPSQGSDLLSNALRWLAEPSAATLGGATMDAGLLRDPAKTQFLPPWTWTPAVTPPPDPTQQPGVVGARTAYSTGQGTVAQWVAAAKQAQLSFLVFLEEFAALAPAKLAQLKQDCAQASGNGFYAIPGFTIDDEAGNHYFYAGMDLAWPSATSLEASGKRFGNQNPNDKGQLSSAVLGYMHSQSGMKLCAGNYLYTQSAAPFADWFANWWAAAVITCRDGQPLEDLTGDFLKLAKSGQAPMPFALNLITDPARLTSSAWRTVITLPPPPPHGAGPTVATLLSNWHSYPDNPTSMHISNGPRIDNWSYAGPRDYEGGLKGDFVWQNYRWLVHGKASSAVGLKEVAVYDGPEQIRRFLPGGQKSFAFTLDMTHDRQHCLVMMVTDVNGGRALSGDQWDRNHRMEEFICGDRNNQLTYGYSTSSDGYGLRLGGGQGLSSPNKRAENKHLSPSGAFFDDFFLGAAAFDGGISGPEPLFWMPLGLRAKDGADGAGTKLLPSPTACESRRLLHTGDVNMGDGRWEHYFTEGVRVGNVWGTMWKTAPAEDFTVVKRNTFFQPDPDSPLAVYLWTADVTLKRDLPNRGMDLGFLATRQARLWAVHASDGTFYAGNWEETRLSNWRGIPMALGPGSYFAGLDSPLGGAAVFPLTPGMRGEVGLPLNRRINFTLDEAATPQRKGETARVEVLLVGIPRQTERTQQLPSNTTEVLERFRAEFGLGGQPPAYTVTPTAGKVLAARYPLKIDGAAQQAFSGALAGKLITTLPIAVSGLNDRWTAVLYDRALKQVRPLGVFEQTAWATLRMHGQADLFIGHPILSDNPNLWIEFTQTGETQWTVEVHNPTDRAIAAALRVNDGFDPLQGHPAKPLNVPAGASVTVVY